MREKEKRRRIAEWIARTEASGRYKYDHRIMYGSVMCKECGVFVLDQATHDRHHEQQGGRLT